MQSLRTSGRESGGSWFETCSGAWYPRRRPCGVAFNTLVDLNKLAGETPSLCDSKVISRALLRFVAVCNWLLPVCRPLLSGANECELSVRPQRELSKRRILDSPLRALEPSRLGLGSHGRVRRRYAVPEKFKFRRTESISVLPLELAS